MSFISFYGMKSYFYFLIYWFLDLSITIIRDMHMEEKKVVENAKGAEFIYVSCLNIADLFSGFLVLCTYKKMKTIEYQENEKKKVEEKRIKRIYHLSIRKHKKTY